jgi:cytochrome c
VIGGRLAPDYATHAPLAADADDAPSGRRRAGVARRATAMCMNPGATASPLPSLAAAALAAAVSLAGTPTQAQDGDVPALLEHYRCTICHSEREPMAGPAWIDVAAAWHGKPKAEAAMVAVIRKGAHGAGPWPMPPLPQVTAADARKIVRYILAQKR